MFDWVCEIRRARLPDPAVIDACGWKGESIGQAPVVLSFNFHHHEGTAMTQWRRKTADETYSPEEIEARLKAELPHWYYEDGWIRRKYKTSGWKATLMVVNTVGHLAEAAWHHPDLTVSYAFVIVKLMNHAAKGVTEKDFALARKIEEVIQWQPGREEGTALEGTPDDPRFKYLKYDAR